MSRINYAGKAWQAEERGDWARAAMWWNYAAMYLNGNPNGLRTKYHQKEDAAKARATEQLKERSP